MPVVSHKKTLTWPLRLTAFFKGLHRAALRAADISLETKFVEKLFTELLNVFDCAFCCQSVTLA